MTAAAAAVVITTVIGVTIERWPHRAKCFTCRRRRELYLVSFRGQSDRTEARCAQCWWGIQ